MRARLALFVIPVLLLASPAFAEHPTFSDSPKAKKGMQQYDDLDLDSALQSFTEAAQEKKLSNEKRALILLYAGLCAMTMGKEDQARGIFAEAIQQDPQVRFPPDEAPAKVSAILEEIRGGGKKETTKETKKTEETPNKVDLNPPNKKEGDEDWSKTGGDATKKDTGGGSNLPLILGIGGGVVAAAAVVVILVLVLSPGGCQSSPSGTGCINIHPTGAAP